MTRPPIVLIHGLWMTPRSWDHFVERYTAAGHVVHAPSWPGLQGDVEAIRADPTPLTTLTIGRIVDHYADIIHGLDAPPIIIGHSFGGLFMQLLVDRGLGAAGVALSGAQPRGVPKLPLTTIKSGSRILRNPLNRNRAVKYTLEDFHYTMTNTLSLEESKPLYERYAIPGAGHILFEGAAAQLNPRTAAKVDFSRTDRAPMLFIAFGRDNVVPLSVTKAIFHKYHGTSSALVEYGEFADRPHFPGVPGWEDVADHALSWATSNAST